jgi:hypothetical protein
MKLLQYVWVLFEKLLAFFEDPILINTGLMHFCVKYVEKYQCGKKWCICMPGKFWSHCMNIS